MERNTFNTDDIHAVRMELDERRRAMSPEEAERDFRESVDRGRRAIDAYRKDNKDAI